VRCLLIEPFPESALNEQAGKMLLENYEEYARHARSALGLTLVTWIAQRYPLFGHYLLPEILSNYLTKQIIIVL
jgi:hypothetical protein